MLKDFEIEDLKRNLKRYLERKGINTEKAFHCINPEHEDKHPSMGYKNNLVHCFACGVTYDLFQAIGIIEGLDKKAAFKRAIELYGDKVNNKEKSPVKETKVDENKNYENEFEIWRKAYLNSSEAQNYLKMRGISEATAEKFQIGLDNFYFDKEKQCQGVIIPTSHKSFTVRNIDTTSADDNQLRLRKRGKVHFLNSLALTNETPYCFIVEGEFDCLSFYEVGINAISLGGCSNIELFKKSQKDKNKTYVLALDNDEAGKESCNKLFESCKLVLAFGSNEKIEFLKDLGLDFNPFKRSLASLKTASKNKGLEGVRVSDIKATLNVSGKEYLEIGEILFKNDSVSGIVVFDLSAYMARQNNYNGKIYLDLMPKITINQLIEILKDRKTILKCSKVEDFLTGMFHKAINNSLLEKSNLDLKKDINNLTEKDLIKLANIIKKYEIIISGCCENNQVFSGGVKLTCLDTNLCSKNTKNLYCIGELVNIDAICGGYNLQWAWTSGKIAGENL